ncbi:carbohydrate esterase family 4 protein [Annulohypoxylon bovei var. microspora]|nr:carbohydrate esterase family 4 protein [Annulohypoxylon bovei var. microspora]
MRFSQVVGGITAALLVSGVPAAKIPKRQDPPASSSISSSTPAPPASTELPVLPPPGSTEKPVPPPPSETPAPPAPTETPIPLPPAPTSSTEVPAPPPVPTSSTQAPPPPEPPVSSTSTEAPAPPAPPAMSTSTQAPAPPVTSPSTTTPVTSSAPAPPAPVETCSAHLLVDDFTQWETGENLLQGATSDDQTMNATSTDGGILTFTPNNIEVSYIYEQFTCLDSVAQGYDSLSFNIKGPEAASVSIELQTVSNCSATEYQSFYYTLDGLSGSLQTINIPLNSWVDADLSGVVGVLWYGFSAGLTGTDNEWQLDNVQFLCADVAPPEDPAPSETTSAPVVTTTPADPEGPGATVTTTVTVALPGDGDDDTTTRFPFPPTSISRPVWPTDPPWWDDDPWGDWPESSGLPASAPATVTPTPEAPTDDDKIVTRQDECSNLLIDDWVSQSRLTFLYYNALLKSSSDDGTMKSIVVKNNRVTFTPTDTDSYFYTQLGCIEAEAYGGVSLRISAPAGSTFDVQLSSTKGTCGTEQTSDVILTTKQLGWTFDGTEKLYSIPFSKYEGLDLTKFEMVFISNLRKAVTFGPMSLYCGEEVAEYIPPAVVEPTEPTETVPAPASKATNLVIDTFANKDTNNLKQWHGADEGMTLTFKKNTMTLKTNDSDLMWVTQVAETCRDLTEFDGSYLHIAYTGSKLFTVALQQHNEKCNNDIYPYPETWDSLEAQRYATDADIYIPLDHFNVNRSRAIGFAFKGFYGADATTVFSRIEIVSSVPAGFTVPEKLPSGTFVFSCKRPNSFAFAIDDGDPVFAQQVMKTIDDAGIAVTFFTVGAPLRDATTNLSAIYNEMAAKGHQIALHSYTHPALEGLADEAAIDWEYSNDIEAVKETFDGLAPKYFRPPFGTEGARMRQRLAALIDDPYIVQWSVDVEDWLWAESDTPEKQLEAFKRDVAAGGDIVVMHYLYNSTVSYLQEFIDIAKATGKQLMRVDQCMMDPNAPPLPSEEK